MENNYLRLDDQESNLDITEENGLSKPIFGPRFT